MRNILGTTLMYGKIVIDLPAWITSPVLAFIAFWCSTHWIGNTTIWTLGTTRWFGITLVILAAAAAKPVTWYFDRLDKEFYESAQ